MTETATGFTGEALTDRELEILQLVAKGKTNREIADRLVLSTETIKWHNKRAYSKLGAGNRTEAVARARAFGFLKANGAQPAEPRNAAAARLPAELSSFVGREREIDAILRLLERARLVTLTGPGGIGKTRLALRVAAAARARFHEAAFVSLATVGDPEQVAHRLA